MRLGRYILDGKQPVAEPDFMKWGRWYERAERHVADTTVGKVRVSTVFLGMDHSDGHGPPILFETMIFGGERDQEQWRYSTWEEASAGHAEAVRLVTLADTAPSCPSGATPVP